MLWKGVAVEVIINTITIKAPYKFMSEEKELFTCSHVRIEMERVYYIFSINQFSQVNSKVYSSPLHLAYRLEDDRHSIAAYIIVIHIISFYTRVQHPLNLNLGHHFKKTTEGYKGFSFCMVS